MRRKRNRPKPPPGLTEEERRKWVWEESDIVITRKGKRPEGEDEIPGR